jgi:hypothetical protein
MGQVRGTQTDPGGAQPHGRVAPDGLGSGAEASCPDCGHPIARHEGSPEDEFVASHGGVGYAFCMEVDPSGETTDPCGCRAVIGSSQEAHERNFPSETTPG